MTFEVTGKVHEIFNTNQVSDRFRKREFVIEIQDGAYQQYIKFQLNQDKTDLVEPYRIGDEVKVSFNLSGKPFTDRNGIVQYFNNLVVWKIEGANSVSTTGAAIAAGKGYNQNFASIEPDNNDLPF